MHVARRARKLTVASALIMALAVTSEAQLKVALKVAADDVDLRTRVESRIRSELRSISGIDVVTHGPRDLEVNALAIGNPDDFAIAFTSVEIGVGTVQSQGDRVIGLRVLCDAYIISGRTIDQMREGTASFSASFDSHCAEPRRKAQRKP